MPKGIPGRSVCSVEGCASLAEARGWCGKHYARWRKHGTVEQYVWRRNDYDPSTGLKRCTGCDQDWPIVCWSPDARRGDGLKHHCRSCLAAGNAAYYEANKDRHNERTREWYQANRQRMREYDKARHDDERRERNRLAYHANKEERKRYIRDWSRRNPDRRTEYLRRRRALKLSKSIGIITDVALAAKFAYWGNRCWMCGTSDEPLEVEHVKPLSKGGAHALANIRPACKPCNSSKRDRWPVPL